MNKNLRVAIFQNTITGGGRITVVNEIVAVLNDMNIIPDFYTLRINPSFKKSEHLKFDVIKIPQYIRGFYELKIVLLNWLMRSKSKNYDLLINSNNSLLFVPKRIPTISYIYFPREMRVLTDLGSLAFPDGLKAKDKNIGFRIYRKFLRHLYGLRKYHKNNLIIADSNFTKNMFLRAYPDCEEESVTVIYPPVEIVKWQAICKKKPNTVTTLGRFCDEKRQLEQIQIAEKLPDFHFNIIGFVGDPESTNFFGECEDYIRSKTIKNVTLHRNLPQEEAIKKLQESQFFMHNLRNEPFGLSTVEAIASGCIPIVPNSGGQIEIVPLEELRFDTKEEAIAKLKNLRKLDIDKIRILLLKTVSQFDLDNFKIEFKKVLNIMISKYKLRLDS